MGNLMVAEPLPNCHRNVAGDEVLRRRTEVIDAETLRDEIELGEHAREISGSPRARRA
jgi:hypothetical protein